METKQIENIKKHIGRPPRFETADELLEAALGYFAECDGAPMQINVRDKKGASSDGKKSAQKVVEDVPRPYTLYGLCRHCGIFEDWSLFKANCKRRKDWTDFERVINACELVVKEQQVTGAMVGLYSERLTARLNGISEKVEQVVETRATMTWEDLREKMAEARDNKDKA